MCECNSVCVCVCRSRTKTISRQCLSLFNLNRNSRTCAFRICIPNFFKVSMKALPLLFQENFLRQKWVFFFVLLREKIIRMHLLSSKILIGGAEGIYFNIFCALKKVKVIVYCWDYIIGGRLITYISMNDPF